MQCGEGMQRFVNNHQKNKTYHQYSPIDIVQLGINIPSGQAPVHHKEHVNRNKKHRKHKEVHRKRACPDREDLASIFVGYLL